PAAVEGRPQHLAPQRPRTGYCLSDQRQQMRETGAVVGDPSSQDRRPGRVRDLHFMAVPMRVDTDDGVDDFCQHGHTASSLLPRLRCRTSAPAWVESPRGMSVTSHATADRLLIRPTWWARPVPGDAGDKSEEGHAHTRGQIRSESPDLTSGPSMR